MTAKGHVTLASLVTLLIIDNAPPYFVNEVDISLKAMFYFSALIGSLFPDIDESKSYIGRRLGVISLLVSSIFKHRTFTHYLIFPIILYFVLVGFCENDLALVSLYGFVVGILLHDIGDMLTKGGIKGFFFPFFANTQIWLLPKVLRFYTASTNEYIIVSILFVLNLILLVNILVRGMF